MPPGTGDAQLTMAQRVALTGAVIVSTPQDIALIDARRGVRMFERTRVPVLGLVENMSFFCCPDCGHRADIFGHGGARLEAQRLGTEFLGEVPLLLDIRTASDAGTPIAAAAPDSEAAKAFAAVAARVWEKVSGAGGGAEQRAADRGGVGKQHCPVPGAGGCVGIRTAGQLQSFGISGYTPRRSEYLSIRQASFKRIRPGLPDCLAGLLAIPQFGILGAQQVIVSHAPGADIQSAWTPPLNLPAGREVTGVCLRPILSNRIESCIGLTITDLGAGEFVGILRSASSLSRWLCQSGYSLPTQPRQQRSR